MPNPDKIIHDALLSAAANYCAKQVMRKVRWRDILDIPAKPIGCDNCDHCYAEVDDETKEVLFISCLHHRLKSEKQIEKRGKMIIHDGVKSTFPSWCPKLL